MTGSFDSTAWIWDLRSGYCIMTFSKHTEEISNAIFEFSGDYAATSSLDKTVRLWDIRKGNCIKCFDDHEDEVLDI